MNNEPLTQKQRAVLIARINWNIDWYQRQIANNPDADGCKMGLIINRIALAELESVK